MFPEITSLTRNTVYVIIDIITSYFYKKSCKKKNHKFEGRKNYRQHTDIVPHIMVEIQYEVSFFFHYFLLNYRIHGTLVDTMTHGPKRFLLCMLFLHY